MEKINILMSTYNGRRYVAKQIESILNQTYQDFRIIVSDDCSTDSTLKILEEYEKKDKRIEIYSQGEKLGLVDNYEFLLDKVRAEMFMFANQDDIWEPEKIEKSLNKMQQNNLDLVYTDLSIVDSKLKDIEHSYWSFNGFDYKIKKYNNFGSLYLNNYITGCTMLIKSKWINEFMPFPKNSRSVLPDYWISLIISQNGKIGYLDEPTVKYRQYAKNNFKKKNEKKLTLNEYRDSIIESQIDHFNTFIQNEKYFKSKKYVDLNKEALKYFENLKNIKKFSLKNISLFFELYKYELFNYKIKNMIILQMPSLAKLLFKKFEG